MLARRTREQQGDAPTMWASMKFYQESYLTSWGPLQGMEEALPMVAEVVSKEAMEISREVMEASKQAGMATQVGATGDSQAAGMAMQVAAMAGEAFKG